MKKFTIQNKRDGEMAARDMSEKAQREYNGSDYSVVMYTDYEATQAAEEKAEAEGITVYGHELEVHKYAILLNNTVERADMTFEEVEAFFESMCVEDEDED